MTDTEIETFSTLLIVLICTVVFSGTVGWWAFLYAFRFYDTYLQEKYWKKKGWKKTVDSNGDIWYIGYDK